jgi:hypothetical protein
MTARGLLAAEFDALLERDYPQQFLDASHLLRRSVRGEDMFDLGSSGRAFLMRWFLESRALKVILAGQARSRAISRPHDHCTVAGLFLPDRPDYAVLLAPVLQELQRQGHRTCVLTENASSVDPRLFAGLEVIDLEHWATLETYEKALGTHGRLADARVRFANEFGLQGRQRQTVELILRAQAWQQHAFAAALSALRPLVVLGLHLTMFPGIAAALRERRASALPVSTILIQHGVFSGSWEEHDFRGADLVLTWGDYFSEELSSFPGPLPRMAAVGHPRLEAMLLSRHNTHKDRANDVGTSSGRHRVVFLGTNGVEADDTAAIELVAEAFQHDASIDLRFLPHPNEPRTKYERLVSSRLIEPDQVVTGGSTYQQVLEAALVLGTQTTMLPESLALGIPVIQVLPERFSVDWQRQGMATASDVDSLQTAARAVLSDPDVKKHLLVNSSALVERMFGDSHGVTDRIIEHVEAELRRVRTT